MERTALDNSVALPGLVNRERADEYRRVGWWSRLSIADHVIRNTRERPAATAFVTPDGRLDWVGYDVRARRLAQALIDLRLAPGERVAIRLPDSASYHVALLACEYAGVVAVGLAARAGERELQHILARTRAVAVISHEEHGGERMSDVVKRCPGVHHHLVVPRFERDADAFMLADGVPVLPEPDADVLASRRIGPDELWLINSTSGTTGLPKCVMHSQNRWYYFHLNVVEIGGLGGDEVVMSVVPTPYGFGLWSSHFTPCCLGAPTVVTERFDPGLTLELLERERVTVLCAVSTQFRMLLAHSDCERRDLSALRVMFTGGEPLPYDASRRFEEITGAAILNIYGSNESGFATATSVADAPEKRLHTAGRVRPGTELRLYDGEGAVTDGRRGQPGTRGPSICLGYLDDPAANRELFTEDGFVLHADLVELDEDGYLTVVGRKSDIIIRGGRNISAREVEDEVAAHPQVALAAAVPIPDLVFGERVCVFAELRQPGALELNELVDFLLSRGVSKETLPERLVILDELPRSAGDKVAKAELREAAGRLAAQEQAS